MKHASVAYAEGVQAALDSFGVRVAEELMSRRMPDGPQHLGAEWLSRAITRQHEEPSAVGTKPSYRPLERPPQWGPRASLEASNANARTGLSYGGV